MSVDQADTIDFATIDTDSGDLWLTISDHLPWDLNNESNHLVLLQNKLNAYLRFVESGEVFKEIPNAKGRGIVITWLVPAEPKGRFLLRGGASGHRRSGLSVTV
jgi:hypothetical protein